MSKKPTEPQSQQDSVTPPANLAAEQSVLGAILLKPAVMDEVADLLSPTDFYREAHRRIFRTMMELYQKNEPVDLVTVSSLLKERGQLAEVGGPLFLTGLSEHVGSSSCRGSASFLWCGGRRGRGATPRTAAVPTNRKRQAHGPPCLLYGVGQFCRLGGKSWPWG